MKIIFFDGWEVWRPSSLGKILRWNLPSKSHSYTFLWLSWKILIIVYCDRSQSIIETHICSIMNKKQFNSFSYFFSFLLLQKILEYFENCYNYLTHICILSTIYLPIANIIHSYEIYTKTIITSWDIHVKSYYIEK